MESRFNRFAGFKTCNFPKKGIRHRCFSVNIAKFLRAIILVKICEQLFLQFLLLTVNITSWELVSAHNLIGLLQRSSSRFKEFSLGCLVVGSSLTWKKKLPKWSLVVIPYHSLSLFVICCHSLSLVVLLVVTRCTTRLSFYKRSIFSLEILGYTYSTFLTLTSC